VRAQQPPNDPVGRPNRRKTPAEVSAGFAATQVRLKQEAAARRAVAKGSPRASGTSRIGHGHRPSGG
jgi:hypothetical protein